MKFIFMLTRNDVTVPDCLDVYEAVRPLGLRHVGFKDLGIEASMMMSLGTCRLVMPRSESTIANDGPV